MSGFDESGFYGYSEDPYLDFDGSPMVFADPGGKSALRAGKRIHPCPTCGAPNSLTAKDKALGYQCDHCADAAEGGGW